MTMHITTYDINNSDGHKVSYQIIRNDEILKDCIGMLRETKTVSNIRVYRVIEELDIEQYQYCYCCHIGCKNLADVVISGNESFEDYTHMCNDHRDEYLQYGSTVAVI